jgi:hypothetical protein
MTARTEPAHQPGDQPAEERCERCELLIGAGCACHVPQARPGQRFLRLDNWGPFAPDTILISPGGYAHLPGACGHLSESEVTEPEWGWITAPEPTLWSQIGAQKPAVATDGNTARTATRRCQGCEQAVTT